VKVRTGRNSLSCDKLATAETMSDAAIDKLQGTLTNFV